MMFRGIRNRVLLVALAPAAMLALVLVTYLTNTRVQDLEQSLVNRGQAIVAQLAPASQHGVLSSNRDELTRLARSAAEAPDVVRIRIYDTERRPLVDVRSENTNSQDVELVATPVPGDNTLRVQGVIFLDLLPAGPGAGESQSGVMARGDGITPEVIGHLSVDLSRSSTHARQTEVILTSLALTLLCLVLAAGLGLIIGRSVIQPVLRLETAVQELRRGNLEARPDVRVEGELGSLARGVAAMAKSLRESHRFLQQQVEQTTAEVRETMEELEVKNAELDIARRRALESSRVKSEFLANISHEIRTPMNGVLGFVELLEKTTLDDAQKAYLSTVRSSAEQLLELVDDILDLSKIEAGRLELSLAIFDPRAALEDVAVLFSANAHKKGLNLVVDVEPEVPPRLQGDRARIMQILANLISNAIKFTDHGGVELHAGYACVGEGEQMLVMRVRDTGIGISPKDQVRLFRPFEQVDGSSTRQQPGTGLGLAISRRLAELMGGRIDLESEPGGGACFTVSIPGPPAAMGEANDRSAEIPDLSGRWICLISHDSGLHRAVEHAIQPAGGGVIHIETVEECTRALELVDPLDQPRYVILDAALPAAILAPIRSALNRLAPRVPIHLTILGPCGGHGDKAPWTGELASLVRIDKPPRGSTLIHRLSAQNVNPTPLPAPPSGQTPSEALIPASANRQPPGFVATGLPVAEGADARPILLADDNPVNRRLACLFLQQMGIAVDEVEDGQQAWDACEHRRYGLILMDVHMPRLDGIEATRRIRSSATGCNAKTPIVALTADALQSERDRFMQSGMDDYLSKPITQTALSGMIQTWVGKEVNAYGNP